MPLTHLRAATAVAGLVGLLPAGAVAQGEDRFFHRDVVDSESQADSGAELSGSVTSTTFVYRESAGEAVPTNDGGPAVHASELGRLFTDFRAKLDGRNLTDSLHAHADLRMRLSTDDLPLSGDDGVRVQSGTLGGSEYEVRRLHAIVDGDSTDLTVGRQIVGELAATRIDGLQVRHDASEDWALLGFAGLYPARGSRSIGDDYPRARTADGSEGSIILPVAAGAGSSYSYERLYGSFGVVGIAPLGAKDLATGERETPRVFATSTGYWRQSLKLDLFHHMVVDGAGSGGAGLTNFNLGANFRPGDDLRINASINRVDTETLNVIAQTRLEDPVEDDFGFVQNNLQVARIAQESARVAVSASLADRRFELSTIGVVRRRPEVEIFQPNNPDDPDDDARAVIPGAQAADVTFRAVDRRSILGLRLAASFSEIFGVGDNNLNRAHARVVRLQGSRGFADGKGEIEVSADFLSSADELRGDVCLSGTAPLDDFERCYGTAELLSATLGTVVFYRFAEDWFTILGLEGGVQKQYTVAEGMDSTAEMPAYRELSQPAILIATGFARLAYRF